MGKLTVFEFQDGFELREPGRMFGNKYEDMTTRRAYFRKSDGWTRTLVEDAIRQLSK